MKRKKHLLLILLLTFLVALPTAALAGISVEQVQENVKGLWKPLKESQPHVTAREFKKIMDSGERFVLLDVRTAEEYEAAHLPGAVNIDRGLLEWAVPRKIKDTDTKIYVYCRTGARAAFAAQRLIEMGYKHTVNIYDAFRGWVEAGFPVYNRHGEFTLPQGGFEKADVAQLKHE